MRKLVDDCNSSNPCPAVWKSSDPDHYFVQGYVVSEDILAKVAPPSGEAVVRVPKSLLINLARDLVESGALKEAASL